MKKLLLLLLIFSGGLVCGYFFNRSSGEVSPAGVSENRAGSHSEESREISSQPPLSQILYTQVLPTTSTAWAQVDFDRIRSQGKPLSDFLKGDAVSVVWKDFTAALPQGVTEVLDHVVATHREMRAFLLPPEEGASSSTVMAFKPLVPDATSGERDSLPVLSLFQALQAAYPGSATSETQAGQQTIQVITTPIGEWAAATQSGVTWLSNHTASLTRLWSLEPPARTTESAPAYLALLEKHPDAAVAVFLNAPHAGATPMGPPGRIPLWLASVGVTQAALFYQWSEHSGRLTVLADAETLPDWAKEWKPLERYALGESDPVGLLEASVRWPAALEKPSVTETVEAASPSTNQDDTPQDSKNRSRGDRAPERRRVRPPLRSQGFQFSADFPTEPFPAESPTPVQTASGSSRWGKQSQVLARMVPSDRTLGVNFFGFYNGRPTIAFVFPDLEKDQYLPKRLETAADIQPTPVNVALLPGALYNFSDHPLSRLTGLDRLLVIDRDAVTYVFEEMEAARYYLGEAKVDSPADQKRDPDVRNRIHDVRSPAQIQIVVSTDCFNYILSRELEMLPKDMPHKDQLYALADEVKEVLGPMVLSAGLQDKEWFLDSSTSSEVAHAVDTVLLGLAIYRFAGF